MNNSTRLSRKQDLFERYFRPGKIKVLTLIALASPIYFDDVGRLSGSIALLGIVCLYLIVRRHIISDVIELVRPNKKVGLVLFLCSMITYVYGSYGDMGPVLHAISLVLFISSYLMLRMNGLLLNILWLPLASLMLVGISENIVPLSGVSAIIASAMLASVTFLSSDIAPFFKILAVIINLMAYSSLQVFLGAVIQPHLVSLSFLEAMMALLMIRRFMSETNGSRGAVEGCRICSSGDTLGGFCPFCGRNLTDRLIPSRLEVLGLMLAIIFSISALFVSIPTLTLTDKGLSITYLTVQGPELEEVRFVSDRWLLYEEVKLSQLERALYEDLVVRQVLVPDQFPEKKNYTVILEISPIHTRIADGWRSRQWTVTDNQQVSLGGTIPVLYYEVSSGDRSLKVITWKDEVVIGSDRGLITREIAVSIFANHTLGYDFSPPSEPSGMAQFMDDVEAFSANTIEKIRVSNSWNSIYLTIWNFLVLIKDFALMAMTAGAIIATALFSVSREDIAETYLLDFLPEKDLHLLLSVNNLNESSIATTGENILKDIKEGPERHGFDQQGILRELEKLEAMKLLKRGLRLGNNTVTMEWRLTF